MVVEGARSLFSGWLIAANEPLRRILPTQSLYRGGSCWLGIALLLHFYDVYSISKSFLNLVDDCGFTSPAHGNDRCDVAAATDGKS